MSVFSGYFNSRDHDRQYNAEEISRFFDGLINDGIFRDYMGGLKVNAITYAEGATIENPQVKISSGRCWFNHLWMLNDTDFIVDLPVNESEFDKIHAIIIDVDITDDVREVTIQVKSDIDSGLQPSAIPFPKLIRESFHCQYVLAYVTVHPNQTKILEENINDRRGLTTNQHEGEHRGIEYGTPFSIILLGNAGLKTNLPGVVMEGFHFEKDDVKKADMVPNLFYGVSEEIIEET